VSGLLAIAALGFFLGMRHATDPDHVIAVATIVTRAREAKSAALIGAVWGIGHTLTILLVGGGIILFGWVIPTRVGLSMELSVGVMLIILGVMNLTGVLGRITEGLATDASAAGHLHAHPHQHGDYVHTHVHGHDPERHPHAPDQTPVSWLDRHLGGLGLYQLLRPLVVGVVHGLAGSAAVALLVLTTIRNPAWAIAYLLIFGLGTIVGMMLITAVIALPVAYSAGRLTRVRHGLRLASGLISLGFGLFLAYRIGIVDGLFTSHAEWTPH
jgi:ABC-type nickel/cobalt efflux system permease component RcnA